MLMTSCQTLMCLFCQMVYFYFYESTLVAVKKIKTCIIALNIYNLKIEKINQNNLNFIHFFIFVIEKFSKD